MMKLFNSWEELGRVSLAAAIVYFGVILLVRLTGKRTVSKMNNYDWLVTVAMGSMSGAFILQKTVPLSDYLTALAVLMLSSYLMTQLSARFDWAKKVVHARSTLLFFDGDFLRDNMLRERVNEQEITCAVRQAGYASFSQVAAVLLESSGDLSVIGRPEAEDANALDALSEVEGADKVREKELALTG